MADLRALDDEQIANIYLSGFLSGVVSGLVNSGISVDIARAHAEELQRRFHADPDTAQKWAAEEARNILDVTKPTGFVGARGKLFKKGFRR